MGTYTDVYIDEIYIHTDDGDAFTGLDNTGDNNTENIQNLFYQGGNSPIITNLSERIDGTVPGGGYSDQTQTGYKYVIQLTNPTGSNVTYDNQTALKIKLCMNYQEENDGLDARDNDDHDHFFFITNGTTIPAGDSIFVGWNLDTIVPSGKYKDVYSSLGASGLSAATGVSNAGTSFPDNATVNDTKGRPDVYLPFYTDSTTSGLTTNNDVLADVRVIVYKTTNGNAESPTWTAHQSIGVNDNDTTNSNNYFFQGSSKAGLLGRVLAPTNATLAGTGGSSGSIRLTPLTSGQSEPRIYTTDTASRWRVSTGYHFTASAAGDPHITTLNGENYKFDYLGAFRLLEHSVNNNNLIINGFSEPGKGRWNNLQYIKKLYIYYNGKDILLDTGFRGTPVNILNNNGIDFIEKKLGFHEDARRYSMSGKGIGTRYGVPKNSNEPATDDLPLLIRNQITILLDDDINNLMSITIENVNQYNLQPCRLFVNLNKNEFKNYKGCLIDRKYVNVCKLSKIDDIISLREPNDNDLLNLPELETEPKLINIKYE